MNIPRLVHLHALLSSFETGRRKTRHAYLGK